MEHCASCVFHRQSRKLDPQPSSGMRPTSGSVPMSGMAPIGPTGLPWGTIPPPPWEPIKVPGGLLQTEVGCRSQKWTAAVRGGLLQPEVTCCSRGGLLQGAQGGPRGAQGEPKGSPRGALPGPWALSWGPEPPSWSPGTPRHAQLF